MTLPFFISTLALANDAILNVEGEIQINGKVVINSEGDYLGKLPTNQLDSLQLINIDKFYPKLGTYKYEQYFTDSSTSPDVSPPISPTETSLSKSSSCIDTIMIDEYSTNTISQCNESEQPRTSSWKDNKDGTETTNAKFYSITITPEGVGDAEYNDITKKNSIKKITTDPITTIVGLGATYIIEKKLIESSEQYDQEQIGKKTLILEYENYLSYMSSIDINKKEYNECYLLALKNNEYEIRCENFGLIAIIDSNWNYKYKLVSFEPNTSQSESLRAKHIRISKPYSYSLHYSGGNITDVNSVDSVDSVDDVVINSY